MKPVSAFVTFTNQEGVDRCLKNFETSKTFFGSFSKLNEKSLTCEKVRLPVFSAPEPSDIVWENYEVP